MGPGSSPGAGTKLFSNTVRASKTLLPLPFAYFFTPASVNVYVNKMLPTSFFYLTSPTLTLNFSLWVIHFLFIYVTLYVVVSAILTSAAYVR